MYSPPEGIQDILALASLPEMATIESHENEFLISSDADTLISGASGGFEDLILHLASNFASSRAETPAVVTAIDVRSAVEVLQDVVLREDSRLPQTLKDALQQQLKQLFEQFEQPR